MNSPLKWMGGKTKLIPFIQQFVPKYDIYYEPFFGSGAMFFSQQPKKAICSDIQAEPILIINAIKKSPNEFYTLFNDLSHQLWEEGSSFYYSLRKKYKENNMFELEKAASFMILLRGGFNGLIRFNPKGEWNVPFGDRGHKNSKSQAIPLNNSFPLSKIKEYSSFLNNGNKQFINQSFEKTIQLAKEGDFIYCDPPYLITTQQYNKWKIEDELLLSEELKKANNRGVKFILSNVYIYKGIKNKDLLDLYSEFKYELKSYNYIVGPGKNRKQAVEEIIIYN